ncbi:hypothetical protein [sulfur-oxidizing endosymbiont of Gigantopelta aegis]|uniref:hypothetical protein n=1 Tax=sulfur-oxidizing endosymbiont of Gigantopelta aegis TaxID=2794934 RepID=UPI0018DDA5F0|nr:hypothetical protein [sulfur-oxidizing endosymbiont of Gigantopelta aegis]
MRGDENATYEWKAPKNGGALWVIKYFFIPQIFTKNSFPNLTSSIFQAQRHK